jgi:hypothetical protein
LCYLLTCARVCAQRAAEAGRAEVAGLERKLLDMREGLRDAHADIAAKKRQLQAETDKREKVCTPPPLFSPLFTANSPSLSLQQMSAAFKDNEKKAAELSRDVARDGAALAHMQEAAQAERDSVARLRAQLAEVRPPLFRHTRPLQRLTALLLCRRLLR